MSGAFKIITALQALKYKYIENFEIEKTQNYLSTFET
jgi:hypothetical protein